MSAISWRSFDRTDQAFLAGRPAVAKPAQPSDNDHALAMELLREGVIAPHLLLQALSETHQHGGRLVDALLSRRLIGADRLYRALNLFSGILKKMHFYVEELVGRRLPLRTCSA